MKLFLIDGIGPFFKGLDKRRVNWSKTPFRHLEKDGYPDPVRMAAITGEFSVLMDKAAALGFNAVTLDDLAHLALHPSYSPELRNRVLAYREAFAPLFDKAAAAGLSVYITTDIMFEPPDYPHPLNHLDREILPFLRTVLEEFWQAFPQVSGLITRIGECDGVDVHGDFRSRLSVRTPRQARTFLQGLLPLFERLNKKLIFRTWTVGAYAIGDLIWNQQTFDQTFRQLDSPALILSLKYGESDFFRYLPTNPLFFRSEHQKLLELQARREYEGFGSYPSFTGWEYEHIRDELKQARNLMGVSIWTCTGGWGPFHRRTFLDPDAVWNEINTETALHLFRDHISTEDALGRWAEQHLPERSVTKLITLMRLSDETIKELLYVDDLARRHLFFRRLRVPPLLAVYWNYIIINHSMRKLLNCLVSDGGQKILQGRVALAKIKTMRQLADEVHLPVGDLDFMYDTFEILALAREYYFGPFDPGVIQRLSTLKVAYKKRYKLRYAIKLDFTRFRLPSWRLRLLMALLIRKKPSYRRIDRLLLIRALSIMAPFTRYARNRLLPDFIHQQAMGLKSILK